MGKSATNSTFKKGGTGTGRPDTSWHPRFLELLGSTCNVTLSAKGAGVDRVTAYKHRDALPDFAAQWDDAKQAAIEILEAEAWQRARKKSDLLMIFLLKAHAPEKYREKVEHTGANGDPIKITVEYVSGSEDPHN